MHQTVGMGYKQHPRDFVQFQPPVVADYKRLVVPVVVVGTLADLETERPYKIKHNVINRYGSTKS